MVHRDMNEIIRIGAVGDICPGDKSIMGIGVLNKTKQYGVDFPLNKVKHILSGFDLLIGNFEGLLSRTVIESAPKQLTFCGHPDFSLALANAGFDVLNLANNHTMEHGAVILLETIQNLKNAGIRICGLRSESSEFYSEPVIISMNEKTIGILGYNWIGIKKFADADDFIAQVHDGIVNYSWNRDPANAKKLREIVADRNVNVLNDIEKLKKKVDIVILMPHWGFEYVHYPPCGVILEAKAFIDAGVDMIIGSHPHVIQGKERYKSSHIFYSLGNFIFDARERKLRYSVLLDISWAPKKGTSYQFHPLYINRQFQPQPADIRQKQRIMQIIDMSNRKIVSTSTTDIQALEDDAVYSQYEQFYKRRKINTIINHFVAIKEDYRVILIIIRKINNFFHIIVSRLKGKKVRW